MVAHTVLGTLAINICKGSVVVQCILLAVYTLCQKATGVHNKFLHKNHAHYKSSSHLVSFKSVIIHSPFKPLKFDTMQVQLICCIELDWI